MMKKTVAALLGALMLGMVPMSAHAQFSAQATLPGVPQAVSLFPTAAPQNRPDGTGGPQIGDREGNTKAVLGHAEYTESARRGKVFSLAATGYTIIAANATGGAIGTFKPIVGFYNPLGSGVNAVLINEEEWHTSGTPGGPLVFNYFCGVNWNSAVGGTVQNNLLSNLTPNGSSMIAQNNTVVTTNPAITTAVSTFTVAGGPAAVAIATATGETGHSKDLKGAIAVPPGCMVALASTATGTSDVVSASLTWEEVAQ